MSSTPAGSAIEPDPAGARLLLHVVPRASRTAIVGLHAGRIKLAVAAPPVDGEANDAIVRFLAKTLGIRKDAVAIVSGQTGKQKTVTIVGLDPATIAEQFGLQL